MLKILFVTTSVAALAISSAPRAQVRQPGTVAGDSGEPAMNSPARSKEAPSAKGPNERMGSPSRDERTMSGENEKASQPATRADEQKMDSREKGRKAEDNDMKAQPGAASRSNSDDTYMREQRGSHESQAPEQRGQRATSTEGGERGAGQISSEQRSKLRTGFKGVQVREASGVNITNVRVGAAIPRTASEYWEPVPVAILEIVPDWRAYRVVRIHDEIVVIDPETFEIVYIF